MRYFPIHPVANAQPIADYFVPDTVQRLPLNMMLDAFDVFWGYGSFIYGKAAAALNKGNLCVQQVAFGSYDKTPNTANLGQAQVVAMNEMVINSFGWFMKAGVAVLKATATVAAAAALGLTGAGTVGANTAGKQILGVTNLIAQTGTKAITNVQTLTGSSVLLTTGYDGWFLGAALTGAGVPAATVVAKMDPDGKTVYMGSAIGTVDKVATASASVTVTATFTGYDIAHIESAISQGAIT